MGKATELMVSVSGGWLYFETDGDTAIRAFRRLEESLKQAGIDASNIKFTKAELRDDNFDTIDTVNF